MNILFFHAPISRHLGSLRYEYVTVVQSNPLIAGTVIKQSDPHHSVFCPPLTDSPSFPTFEVLSVLRIKYPHSHMSVSQL